VWAKWINRVVCNRLDLPLGSSPQILFHRLHSNHLAFFNRVFQHVAKVSLRLLLEIQRRQQFLHNLALQDSHEMWLGVRKLDTRTAKKKKASQSWSMKYSLTTKDMLLQAQAIVASMEPRVEIPRSIIRVVERCIKVRVRYKAWFRNTDAHNDYSDVGHTAFRTTSKRPGNSTRQKKSTWSLL
jgi:hypothetical protein